MVGLTEAACSFLCDEAVVVRHDLRDHLDSGDGCGGDGGGGGAATNMPLLLCLPAPLKASNPHLSKMVLLPYVCFLSCFEGPTRLSIRLTF